MLFMAGLTMLGHISPAVDQTTDQTEERMQHSVLCTVNSSVVVYVGHCMCSHVLVGLYTVYIVFMGKIKYICYPVFVCAYLCKVLL